MARWTGTWLSGLGAAGYDRGTDAGRDVPPGLRLGLPVSGPGAVAATGRRVGAFALDCELSGLVARLFFPVRDLETPSTSLGLAPVAVLAAVYLLGLALVGQTPGMRLLGLRVVPVGGGLLAGGAGPLVDRPTVDRPLADRPPAGPGTVATVGLLRATLRTLLLLLLVPAIITDRDGRGLHDRAAGAAVVRT